MFSTLIRGLLSAFGLVKRTRKFTTEHNGEFVKSLAAGTVVLTWARNPNFLQGGIQGATNSIVQHALIYVGKSAATLIRQQYPELIKNKNIPKESQYHETVEAKGEGIVVTTLEENLNENTQMVAYTRELTTSELLKILYRLYSQVGKPYDYLEFIGDAFPDGVIPNPDGLFVCSSLTAHAYLPVERIVKPKVDIKKACPRDLNDYLEPNLKWLQTRYNW